MILLTEKDRREHVAACERLMQKRRDAANAARANRENLIVLEHCGCDGKCDPLWDWSRTFPINGVEWEVVIPGCNSNSRIQPLLVARHAIEERTGHELIDHDQMLYRLSGLGARASDWIEVCDVGWGRTYYDFTSTIAKLGIDERCYSCGEPPSLRNGWYVGDRKPSMLRKKTICRDCADVLCDAWDCERKVLCEVCGRLARWWPRSWGKAGNPRRHGLVCSRQCNDRLHAQLLNTASMRRARDKASLELLKVLSLEASC